MGGGAGVFPALGHRGFRGGVDLFYTTLLDAGVPPAEVPRMERLVTTLAFGYGASEVGGRFAREESYVRVRRGQLGDAPLPGHKAVIRWLECADGLGRRVRGGRR